MTDLQSTLDAVDEAIEADELEKGLALVRSGLEQHPENAELLARLGLIHLYGFRYAEAIAPLQRAAELAPNHASALYDLGVALRYEGDVERALQVHERLLAAHPHSRKARFALALTRTVMGRPDKALPEMERLVKEEPGDHRGMLGLARTLSRLGRFTEALHLFDALLADDPDFVDALVYKSEAANRLARTREWMAASRHAHEVFPNDPLVHYQMHLVCLLEGNGHGALAHLQQALELHPHCVEALVGRGNLLWRLGDLDPAQEALEQAASLASWNGMATGMLARFLVGTGRGQPDLERLSQQAQALRYSGLSYYLGRLYMEHLKEPARAEHFFRLAVKHVPEWVDALHLLGDALVQQDRTAEAVPFFRRAVELSPELGLAWNGLALSLGREGRTKEALQAYTEAVRLLPNEISVLQGYAAALIQSSEAEHALQPLQHALDLQPQSGQTLFLVATALEDVGRPAEALEAARRAQQWLSEDEDVRELLERLQHSTSK